MAAIITDTLRRQTADTLLTEILDTAGNNSYFIGVGKSDQYDSSDTAVTPVNSLREQRIARANLQSVKQITSGGASFVVPRYNWASGTVYSGWSDAYADIPANTYYVLTEDNEVYICLQQGRNSLGIPVNSIVKPSYSDASVSQTQVFETADGYRWKFLYALSPTKANNFLSSNYIPTQFVADSSGTIGLNVFEIQQAQVKEAAVGGQITGVSITNGGAGYATAPTVTFRGDGSGAQATATINNGTVVKIEMNNESASLGSGYLYSSIELTGGSPSVPAVVRPIISTIRGIGYDPVIDLLSTSIMVVSKPAGDESGTFLTGQDFRQILVMKNLEWKDSDGLFDGTSGKALKALRVDNAGTLAIDNLMSGDSASAYIDQISGTTVFYHQNETTGFGTFGNGETISDDGGGTATVVNAQDSIGFGGQVDAQSGDLLYIENRARILRDPAQTEDIKVILTF